MHALVERQMAMVTIVMQWYVLEMLHFANGSELYLGLALFGIDSCMINKHVSCWLQ